jgi:tetratricopeptide (TPR) repeat protein
MDGERVVGHFVSPYSYEHFIRGELARAHGDLETAARELSMARAGPEEDPLVMSLLAEVLEELDRSDEADRLLEDAERRFPDAESVWLARGRIFERRGEAEAAIGAYEAAEARAPRSEEAPLALARLLRAEGANGRADAVLTRYVSRSGGTVGALRAQLALSVARRDAPGAVRAVRALLLMAPARTDEVVAVARTALDAGRPILAARLLDATPNAPPVLRLRALLAAHRETEAEALLATLRDDELDGPLGRARFLLAVGRAEEARDLADIVAAETSNPSALVVAGQARLSLGETGEAARLFARVPSSASDATIARLGLAEALATEGSAGAAAEVLASAEREDPRVRERLAALRLRRGDAEGARRALGEGDDAVTRALRARLADQSGPVEAAIGAWRLVPPDDPALDRPTRLRARAERLIDNGERDAAIETLRTLHRIAPDDLAAAARLGELLRDAGRRDDARNLARELAPLAIDETTRARLDALSQ